MSIDYPDVDTVYRNVLDKIPSISLDTVYRTLGRLTELGLIEALNNSKERIRFDANLNRHHHFFWVQCGLLRDLYSDQFNNLMSPESVKAYGNVETIQVEIRGGCHSCAESKNSKPVT